MSVPPEPWPGQNTAIYRTGATWASKWSLGPARALLERPAGHFGPVSGAARALEMSVRDPPKQCYLPYRSHLGLKMATWTCLGAAGVSGRAVWACCGVAQALKMAAQSLQCSHLALEIASQACPGAGGVPRRPIGLVLALPGCSKWLLRAGSVPEKGFPPA